MRRDSPTWLFVFESSKFITHSHLAVYAARNSSGKDSHDNAVLVRCAQALYTEQYYSGAPPFATNGNIEQNAVGVRVFGHTVYFTAVKTSEDADTARLYVLAATNTGSRYIHAIEFCSIFPLVANGGAPE